MKDSIHVSKENYLKAILEAEAEGREVIPALLAHWLEVSAPAVTMALKRLKRDGFVEVTRGIVRLTTAGRETAYRTALRHHLIERMLSEIFGMEWHEIHEEAERLEHAVSPAFEAKLREKLGEGGACPHGNHVLPESPAERKQRGEIRSRRPSKGGATPSSACTSAIPSCCFFCTARASVPARACAWSARTTIKPFRLSYLPGFRSLAGRRRRQFGCDRRTSKIIKFNDF